MRRLFVQSVQPILKNKTREMESVDRSRLWVFKLAVVGMMGVLVSRLFSLQLIQGAQMRERSDNNRIYVRELNAGRGIITDRNGDPLVVNRPVFRMLTDDEGRILLERPLVSKDRALELKVNGNEAVVVEEELRYYPYGNLSAHIVGYVGEASQAQVNESVYRIGQVVGKAGLEQYYDSVLQGRPGQEMVEIDAQGRLQRRVGTTEPVAGSSLKLFVDMGLQEVVAEAMKEVEFGSVIVSDPRTGAVLSLYSKPSFDTNVFSGLGEELGEYKNQEVTRLLSDEQRPMLNRAIAGTYPPGSVFKVVPATAGMETGVLEQETLIEDVGELTVDEYSYGNWYFSKYGRTEGAINVVTALRRSNDIFFYKLGEWLGPDRLASWSRSFGLGNKSGIDLPGEVAGLVPDSLWKERFKGEPWYLGNTYHFSIGQGDLLVTPLQSHQMMGVVASAGMLCQPRLVDEIAGVKTQSSCKDVGLDPRVVEVVTEGLIEACNSGGTAFPFFDFELSEYNKEWEGKEIACKTGTAQYNNPEEKTHAWFSVFAPVGDPEVMVTVMVEGGGEGSEAAAPIAREILSWWLRH